MRPYIKTFEDRLAGHFDRKAEEFSNYSSDKPSTMMVTKQLADLYKDLANIMRK
jgi:hypothetical protein